MASIIQKNKIIVQGLIVLFILTNVVSAVFATQGTWVTKASMWQSRDGLGVAVVDGKIFAIGGYSRNTFNGNNHLGTIEVYKPQSNKWSYPNPTFAGSMVGCKTPMPTPRSRFGVAVVDDKIYCIGGWTSNNETAVNEVYDPKTDTWETKAPMPTARGDITANVVDGKIYVIGGKYALGDWYGCPKVTEVYDPKTDSWTAETPIPYAVSDYASAVLDNKIYIIGGHDLALRISYDLTQIYNPQTGNWSFGAQLPRNIYYSCAASTTGVFAPKRIYLLGGTPLGLSYVYYPENDTWTLGPEMPTTRILLSAAVINDTIYTLGGDYHQTIGPSFACTVVEQYTPVDYIPEFSSWVVLPLFFITTVIMVTVRIKISRKEVN